jgi:uncharacterized protein DUF5990
MTAMQRKATPAGRPKVIKADRRSGELEVPMRVVLVHPPAGVQFCLQGRGNELIGQTTSTGADLSFDLVVRVVHDKKSPPRFIGPFPHGPSGGKFLYVCVGTLAGQPQSCWSRRAKVPLYVIPGKLIDQWQAMPSARLEARFNGTGKDGGPTCATVQLLEDGWRVVA